MKILRWRWILRFPKWTNRQHLIKQATLYSIGSKFQSKTFIETGTFLGEMMSALRNQFEELYSIELDPQLAKNAKQTYSNFPQLNFYEGDSSLILDDIISSIQHKRNPIFWLDGHYSGGETAKGDLITPIRRELSQIAENSAIIQPLVLIDDARLFNGENDYPSLKEISRHIEKLFPEHHWYIKHDIIHVIPNE